jgi:hypothetical protein
VHESELYDEVSDFSQPFVLHGVACPRFAFLGVSGVNVVSEMFSEICGSCLLNKQIYTPTNFWQQILIWNHDPELKVGWIQTQLKWKP